MNSLSQINAKINAIIEENADLEKQIIMLRSRIDANNKICKDLQGVSVSLNLTNDEDIQMVVFGENKHLYADKFNSAIKRHKLTVLEQTPFDEPTFELETDKRILKSTLSVLISLIKNEVVIKTTIDNNIYYIKKTESFKVGLFNENADHSLTLTEQFFGVKLALESLGLLKA